MIDFHKDIVKELKTILPTHSELTMKNEKIPCITYLELSNNAEEEGDTIGYSRIQYQVKVWAMSIAEIQRYSKQIDTKLRAFGFKRTSCGEVKDENSALIQKIMTYEAKALETY